MKIAKSWIYILALVCGIIFIPRNSWPQLTLGQYEDEAPFRTWNTFGLSTASSLAQGEIQFTLAADSSAALSNPALLSELPNFTLTLNSSVSSASFFKYSIVNTGVLYSRENIFLNLLALDFAGISLRVKNWTFALSIALPESYYRPEAKAQSSSYSLEFVQEGELKNVNFSLAWKVARLLAAGIGVNYVFGDYKKDIIDQWTSSDITITDSLSHEFRGFYLNGGLLLDFGDRIRLAAVFRSPYVKKADSHSLKRNYSPAGDTDIKIEASSQSEYKQPLVIGLGLSCEFSPNFRAASEAAFYQWSKYEIIYFEQEGEIQREFKDVVKVGAGVEYTANIKLFGQRTGLPLRAGMCYDPQPMKEPNSSYLYFSLGTGLHWGKLNLDVGMLFGKESGSGDSLSAKKFGMSLSFRL